MTHLTATPYVATTLSSQPHRINLGDRIFVRLSLNGRTLLEYTSTSIGSMTELTGETRRRIAGIHGLCTLYIRNMSQGWSTSKPLMIYRNRYTPLSQPAPRTRMICPWETH